MYPKPLPEDRPGLRLAYGGMVALILLMWLLPLLAVMLTATRSYQEIMAGNYWGLVRDFSLIDNIRTVFSSTAMTRYFLNSLLITVPTVVLVLTLATLSGFVLSRYRFAGATLIFALFIGGNFLPAQIMMIPVRDLMVSFGLYDTHLALIVFHTAFQTGFATLFMRNFISSLPSELFQAARAEGASPGQILVHVVLPLMRPALAALAILIFTFVWNDYFWAVILTQSDTVKPVTAGLNNLRGQWTTAWNLVAVGTLFIAIPPVLMFFTMQRHFIAGLTMGAVKG